MTIHIETRAVVPAGCTIAEIRAVLDGFDGSARLIDVVLADNEHRRVALPDLVDVVLVVAASASADRAQPRTDDHLPVFADGRADDHGPDERTVRTDDHGRCSATDSARGSATDSASAAPPPQPAATGAAFAPHTTQLAPHAASLAVTTPQATPVDISDLIDEAEKIADDWPGRNLPSARALASSLRGAGFRMSRQRQAAIHAHVTARAATPHHTRRGAPQGLAAGAAQAVAVGL